MTQSAADEYILISVDTYKQLTTAAISQPSGEESTKQAILQNKNLGESETLAQLSIASALNSKSVDLPESGREDEKKKSSQEASQLTTEQVECVIDELTKSGLSGGKIERGKTIIKLLNESTLISIDGNTGKLHGNFDGSASTSDLIEFSINLQLPTKKISSEGLHIFKELKKGSHLVGNKSAKQAASCAPQQHSNTRGQQLPWLSMF